MARQDRLVPRRDDRLGELGREESLQTLQPLELLDLRPHTFFERPVQLLIVS
jgi:hypothetical protein